MKRLLSLLLIAVMLISFSGCADDSFGHETYTDLDDYDKVFELTEIRYGESAFELFPREIDELAVSDFYCEWELGIVGSAKVEILLSVDYEQESFADEISRLQALGGGNIVYDTEHFQYPAYVSVLGHMSTSYYALVDEANLSVYYVMLQIIDAEDIDISKDLLPKGYCGLGTVKDISYNIYE